MPKGPRGERRPADPNKLAAQIVRIAVGDEADSIAAPIKSRAGKIGSRKRMLKLTPEQRSEIARAAAVTRWKKGKG